MSLFHERRVVLNSLTLSSKPLAICCLVVGVCAFVTQLVSFDEHFCDPLVHSYLLGPILTGSGDTFGPLQLAVVVVVAHLSSNQLAYFWVRSQHEFSVVVVSICKDLLSTSLNRLLCVIRVSLSLPYYSNSADSFIDNS